ADPETIRATAHQLVELPQVRGLVAGLLGGLREVAQEPRNLAWVIRTLEAVERQAMPNPADLSELGHELQELAPVLADLTYEQLALRIERQRRRLEGL
ncbi:MAG TPA: hypothetical protein VFS21_01785, partial [Roseiflexaceae bacterium]|nr:hypothetical protein [Roseiflexaceae bacterium]